MDISVIVIAYNEEHNIADCLDSLTRQVFSKGKIEIIVVDGMSQDKTPYIVEEFVQRHDYIKLVSNLGRAQSSNRNAGISAAQYPFVAFTDADCICPDYWLERLSEGFDLVKQQDEMVGAVGGGNISDIQFGSVSSAIGIACNTPISALGSQQTRIWTNIKEVESLATLNVLYDKSVFSKVGMFNENQVETGEDWVLNYHLREQDYHLYYVPNATILHKMRTTFTGFIKQMFCYGLGRGRIIQRKPKTISWRYILPILFLIIMVLSMPSYLFTKNILFLIPMFYFPAILIYTVILCGMKRKIILIPHVIFIFFSIHFTYSIGECIGLFKGDVKK